jgi:hypothetical protein
MDIERSRHVLLVLAIAVVAIFASIWFHAHRAANSRYASGDIYSVVSQDGFSIAKVLAVDPTVIHVRIYKQHYSTRPQHLDLASLTLGTIDDPDGFGVGHVPLKKETFSPWDPVLITHAPVSTEELAGYEAWKESKGGVWQ